MNRAVKKELHNRGLYNNHTHNPRKKALLHGEPYEPTISVQEAMDNIKNIVVTSLRRYGIPVE
jgi:hypothetical protein